MNIVLTSDTPYIASVEDMAENVSAEYLALVRATDKMISELAADPLSVASKLMAKGLIPPAGLSSAQLQAKEKEMKASELVTQVINKVNNFPDEFESFLAVLNTLPWLQRLAKWISDECIKIKTSGTHTVKNEYEMVTPREFRLDSGSDQDQGPPQPMICPKKFPYLKADNLSCKRREALVARLERESRKMQDKFAILVDRTRESLEKQNITCSDLSVLVRHSHKNKLLDLFKNSTSIKELFLELGDYWWFFDYEFLNLIITRHCMKLEPELSMYVASFKEYCERRICEVPNDVFKERGDENNLYVKCDHNFDKNTITDVKDLERKLSDLLETDLYLLGVEEGCIKLVFYCLCAITIPLTQRQVDVLKALKVISLYDHNNTVYFDEKDFSIVSNAGAVKLSLQEQLTPQLQAKLSNETIILSAQWKFRKMILDVSDKLTMKNCKQIMYLDGINSPQDGISVLSSLEAHGYISPGKVEHLENVFSEIHRLDLLPIITKYKESKEYKDSVKKKKKGKKAKTTTTADSCLPQLLDLPSMDSDMKSLYALLVTHTARLTQKMETLHDLLIKESTDKAIDEALEQFKTVATDEEKFVENLHRILRSMPKTASLSRGDSTASIDSPSPRRQHRKPHYRMPDVFGEFKHEPHQVEPLLLPTRPDEKTRYKPKEAKDNSDSDPEEDCDSGIGYVSHWTEGAHSVDNLPGIASFEQTYMPLLPRADSATYCTPVFREQRPDGRQSQLPHDEKET